ncbi:major facilitator superfamily domain-containing protein 12-like isoform X1 [Branchiostoma floridae]|uniref:Major facilitator superfamily domain-containing protein 12-like isoform X1 n=1 Tax=Branchiostoma floridae TaxID=7739 RepID=A0A9J7MHF6_BRAFL|nr:major facilitator superfamily domain-containing protein 12-like isoform X1 [Branchiostoma floridae]
MSEPQPRGHGYRSLPRARRFTYGVGHMLNDLCASMWFSYLLVYFHKVVNFSNVLAGQLLMVGQVSDALCTPFVGYESDRTKSGCGYGRRKIWHLVGTVCVACSFPFIFNLCITCSKSPDWAQFIYYAPFVVIFQFGWASTQISHLALIPDLASSPSLRVELNAIRYAFTVLANVAVYAIAWLLLGLEDRSNHHDLSPEDADEFRNLAFIAIGIGLLFSFIFHMGTKEPLRPNRAESVTEDEPIIQEDEENELIVKKKIRRKKMSWKCWLKEVQFYQVALLYMCTRLMVNMSQVYMPLYLTDTLNLDKAYIATIPLVTYLSGFLSSFAMKAVNKAVGRKMTFFLGVMCVLFACDWMWVPNIGLQVYGAAVLLGVGGSTVLVTSLSMTADLIGENLESGAFVYGAMSFTDKLSNGLAVTLVQTLHPCSDENTMCKQAPCDSTESVCCDACQSYYQEVMVFVPGGVGLLALLVLATMIFKPIGIKTEVITERQLDNSAEHVAVDYGAVNSTQVEQEQH